MNIVVSVVLAVFLVFFIAKEDNDKYKVYNVQCSETLSLPLASNHVPTTQEIKEHCSKDRSN
jgi:hypothetical protein